MSAIIKRKVQEIKEAVESPVDNDLSFITRKIEVDSVLSTGSTLLDLNISGKRRRGGGIPGGIVVEMYGPSSSGKTALLAEICASAQALGGQSKIQDPEARLDKEYARIYDLKLDPEDYSRPDTVEEVFNAVQIWKPRDPSKINVLGTDSLAALSTELEMSPKGDKMGMKRAKEFSTGFRKTARLIAQNNWLMLCTNQIRQGDYGETTPGGMAVAFYSSLRIRVKQEDLVYKEISLDGGKKVKKAVGIESTCFIKKSSIDDPFRECSIFIMFGYGIDDIRGNLQYIKDMTNDAKYQCPDGNSYGPMSLAIQHIEKDNLEKVLKERTIDLWEEIESRFESKRNPKVR